MTVGHRLLSLDLSHVAMGCRYRQKDLETAGHQLQLCSEDLLQLEEERAGSGEIFK